MKIVALVMCDDHLYWGGKKTINSLKFFHPEIDIALYDSKEINRIKAKYKIPDSLWFSAPCIIDDYLKSHEKPDILIKIGADCLVLDQLNEIYELDFDVASARNDPDEIGDRDERHNRPDIIRDIPNHEWVNADFVVIKNLKFAEDWFDLTMKYKNGEIQALKDFGKVYQGDDMSSLNVVFRTYGYKSLILDPLGSNLIYGSSANNRSSNLYCAPSVQQCYNGIFYNWSSWYDVKYNGKKCMLNDRIVKVLHQGGGTSKSKMNLDLFNSEFREYVKKVTGMDE